MWAHNPATLSELKQLCRFVSLKHNIYIAADPTSVNTDHDAHAWAPTLFTHTVYTNFNLWGILSYFFSTHILHQPAILLPHVLPYRLSRVLQTVILVCSYSQLFPIIHNVSNEVIAEHESPPPPTVEFFSLFYTVASIRYWCLRGATYHTVQ